MDSKDKEACVIILLADHIQNNFLEAGCIGLNVKCTPLVSGI